MVRRPLRQQNPGSGEPEEQATSSLSCRQLYRYVRFPILAIVFVAMLDMDYETIADSGLKRMVNIQNKTEAWLAPAKAVDNQPLKNESSSKAASIIGLVKEKLNGPTGAQTKTHLGQAEESFPTESTTRAESKEDTTLHSTQTAILDLADWERESLEGITGIASTIDWTDAAKTRESVQPSVKSCNPPNGISKKCCLGTFSTGGGVEPGNRWMCAASLQPPAMEELKEAVRQLYVDNPLLPSHNNNEVVQCDLCQVLEIARQHSLNIALIGDSMHSQVAQGLDCELERRNYLVKTETVDHSYTSDKVYNRRHVSSTVFTISSPEWAPGDSVAISYHMIYKAPLCEGCGDFLSLTATADVVVMGFGLHWWNGPDVAGEFVDHRQEGYVKNLVEVLEQIRAQGRVQLLVHRETSAQHFDGDGGGYEFWMNKPQSSPAPECKRFSMNDASVYWRERSMQRIAELLGMTVTPAGPNMPPLPPNQPSSNLTEIVSLPYFHFTAGFPLMHPKNYAPGETMMDCTHFCGSPFMYYPLWRSLRFAIDRKYASLPTTGPRRKRR